MRLAGVHSLLSGALGWQVDDPQVVEVAGLERLMIHAVGAGGVAGNDGFDDQFCALLDAAHKTWGPASL